MKKMDSAKQDYVERLIHMTNAMEAHIEADAIAFRALSEQLIETNKDLKSLLSSRSFLRGTWFAVGVFGTLIAAIAAAAISWFR